MPFKFMSWICVYVILDQITAYYEYVLNTRMVYSRPYLLLYDCVTRGLLFERTTLYLLTFWPPQWSTSDRRWNASHATVIRIYTLQIFNSKLIVLQWNYDSSWYRWFFLQNPLLLHSDFWRPDSLGVREPDHEAWGLEFDPRSGQIQIEIVWIPTMFGLES